MAKEKPRWDDPCGARPKKPSAEKLPVRYQNTASGTSEKAGRGRVFRNISCLLGGSRRDVAIKTPRRRSSRAIAPSADHPVHESLNRCRWRTSSDETRRG